MAGCKKTRGDKPKMKTNSGAKKRFKVTGKGKVRFWSKGTQHCLSNKSRKVKRQKKRANYMSDGDVKLISRLLPYGKIK